MNEHREVTESIPMMLVLIRPAQANRYADDLTAAFTRARRATAIGYAL